MSRSALLPDLAMPPSLVVAAILQTVLAVAILVEDGLASPRRGRLLRRQEHRHAASASLFLFRLTAFPAGCGAEAGAVSTPHPRAPPAALYGTNANGDYSGLPAKLAADTSTWNKSRNLYFSPHAYGY